jgi:hemimethylated DNA binding protein
MSKMRAAKFKIDQIVKHRVFPFRCVVFDVDRSAPAATPSAA